jgi:hypothetical protein
VVYGFYLLLIDHREVIHLSTRLLHDNVELLLKFLLSLLHHLLCSLSVVFFKLSRIPRIDSDALIAVGAGLPVAIKDIQWNDVGFLQGQVGMILDLFPAEAILSIELECLLQEFQPLQAEVDLLRPLPVAALHPFFELLHGPGIKHIHARHHREKQGAERPHVNLVVVSLVE